MKNPATTALILICLLAACAEAAPEATPSVMPAVETATATNTQAPSATPAPSVVPTLARYPGTLEVQVNVRSGPGTGYEALGLLAAGQAVEITAVSADGSWLQVLYPAAPSGSGWISAQYVQVTSTGIPSVTPALTPTPEGAAAVVSQRLNVRAGPATTYDALGTLEVGTTVALTGRNLTGTWLQIAYAEAPGGHGWVSAGFLQVSQIEALPILDAAGNPVTVETGQASAGTPAPTPTPAPAMPDGDSAQEPLARVIFGAADTRTFIASDRVSSPEGDVEDWIEFTPIPLSGGGAALSASLMCHGTGTLTVELWQGGEKQMDWGTLMCGAQNARIFLTNSQVTSLRLSPAAGNGLQMVEYELTLRSEP